MVLTGPAGGDRRVVFIVVPDARLTGFLIRSRDPRVRDVKAAVRAIVEAART